MQRDEPLPCHQTINYDDPSWLVKWSSQEEGSICGGSLIFMANKLQRPRTPKFPTMPPDKGEVFSNVLEFVRYHREAAVHSWSDDDQSEEAKLQRELIKRAGQSVGQPIIDYKNKAAPVPLQNIPVRSELGRKIRQDFAKKPKKIKQP